MVYIRDSFADLFPLLEGKKEVVTLIDSGVEPIFGNCFPYRKIIVNTSEQNKSFTLVQEICEKLLEMEVSRGGFLLCVGGGILTDVGGFVASIYKRGIKCGYVSTTLLAQVDASIGGKTGINLAGYKNAVGTFSMPEFTYINTELLKSLPEREYKAGLAELYKTLALRDREMFLGGEDILKMIERSVEIKNEVVKEDPTEKGLRKILNFGHTFGHAIERCASNKVLHGEAVAAGMAIAARLSHRLGYLSKDEMELFINKLCALGFEVEAHYSPKDIMEAIKNDKKRVDNGVDFVFLHQIGEPCIGTISVSDLEREVEHVLY